MIKFYSDGPEEVVALRSRIDVLVNQLNTLKTKFSDLHLKGQWEAARRIDDSIKNIEEAIRSAHLTYTGTDVEAKVRAFCKENNLDSANYKDYRTAIMAVGGQE